MGCPWLKLGNSQANRDRLVPLPARSYTGWIGNVELGARDIVTLPGVQVCISQGAWTLFGCIGVPEALLGSLSDITAPQIAPLCPLLF
jgi:hypothetical protein